jgi:hypothetical protein
MLPGCLLGLHFNPEDGVSTFFKNVRQLLPNYTMSDPRNTILHVYRYDNLKVITNEISFAFGLHSNHKPQPQASSH